MTVVLLDAGLGNLRSVEKALAHVGADVVRTGDPDVVARAERLVVPGQGHFGAGAAAMGAGTPLGEAVLAAVQRGVPYLGICLGLQLLFPSSEEAPGARGLGLLDGAVRRMQAARLPHMGWNGVSATSPHPLGALATGHFYFAHSYAADDGPATAARVDDAGPLVAAVARDNLFAVQFHPEKSQRAGLALLAGFLAWRP